MDPLSLSIASVTVGAAGLLAGAQVIRFRRRQRRDAGILEEKIAKKLDVPRSLHPVIDTSRCIGSLSCLKACPEGDILGIVDGAARLVHASIVDGMRLCKAAQDTYKHSDMGHLEEKLQEHQDKRARVVITDGVFSMDGDLAKLDAIVALAKTHDAMVFVDDSHASGFIGKTGRGTHEHCGVVGKIDIITTTLGKALGGASGGSVSGPREVVELLRQRSRPYLFSNTLAPPLAAAGIDHVVVDDFHFKMAGLRDDALDPKKRAAAESDLRRAVLEPGSVGTVLAA